MRKHIVNLFSWFRHLLLDNSVYGILRIKMTLLQQKPKLNKTKLLIIVNLDLRDKCRA